MNTAYCNQMDKLQINIMTYYDRYKKHFKNVPLSVNLGGDWPHNIPSSAIKSTIVQIRLLRR